MEGKKQVTMSLGNKAPGGEGEQRDGRKAAETGIGEECQHVCMLLEVTWWKRGIMIEEKGNNSWSHVLKQEEGSCAQVTFYGQFLFSKGNKAADMAQTQATEQMGGGYTGEFLSEFLQAQITEEEGEREMSKA